VFCYAETFSGKLIDAACYENSQTSSRTATSADRSSTGKLDKECAPTASTSNFAIQTSGKKVYKLDHAGNTKATEAMQSGAIKPDNDGDVHVSVSGSKTGNSVKVDSIEGKQEHR
jgi:hypothetical protein